MKTIGHRATYQRAHSLVEAKFSFLTSRYQNVLSLSSWLYLISHLPVIMAHVMG